MKNKKKFAYMTSLAALVALVGTGCCKIKTVDESEKGIKKNWGKIVDTEVQPGPHWVWPWQDIVTYSLRLQRMDGLTETSSVDAQTANMNYALTYKIDPSKLSELYKYYGNDLKSVEHVLLEPMMLGGSKNATGQVKAIEFARQRSQVADGITSTLQNKLQSMNAPVEIQNFELLDFTYSPAFKKAIDEKVVAEQQAVMEQNKIETEKAKMEQAKIKAQAEAEMVRIKAQAEAETVKIKADAEAEAVAKMADALDKNSKTILLKAVEKWKGEVPTILGGDDKLFIDVRALLKQQQAQQKTME